jgi:hypothetical protein
MMNTNLHTDPRQKELCPDCGHRWFAHHHRGQGCLYQNSCNCMRVNPASEDDDQAALAMRNGLMGR